MTTHRDFVAADVEACLAVFDSNVPDYFHEAEREEFAAFLGALPGPYLVLVDAVGEVVGCGGYARVAGTGRADLCWGMVANSAHRKGLGRALTQARIDRVLADPAVTEIVLNTSQHTVGFYERMGFETVAVTPDGYAPGLDRHDMRLMVGGSVEIRMLQPEDGDVLERVAADVFDGPVRTDLAREFLTDPRHHMAVALEAGVVVGFASGVHYIHVDKPAELFVNEVGVAPTHQRRGLGRSVVEALLDHGRSLDCEVAWVLTDRSNHPAMSLYAALGAIPDDDDVVLFSMQL